MSTKYHTTTHLMYRALRLVAGQSCHSARSNITPSALRFDFIHSEKMTPEQIAEVEKIVNEQIARDWPVTWREENTKEALASGSWAPSATNTATWSSLHRRRPGRRALFARNLRRPACRTHRSIGRRRQAFQDQKRGIQLRRRAGVSSGLGITIKQCYNNAMNSERYAGFRR